MGNKIVQKGLSQLASSIAKKATTSISTKKEIDKLRLGVVADRISILERRVKDKDIVSIESFPSDLRKFYMRLDFNKYSRPSPEVEATLPPSDYSVCFPIPTNLEDQYRIDYDNFDAGIAGIIMNSLNNPGITAAGIIKPTVDVAKRVMGESIVNIASQNLKASLNPLKSVLFKSPQFKSYNFSWNFAPNTEEESRTLRSIIRKLKGYSLPTYAKSIDGNTDYNIFNYPYMVKASFYPWSKESNRENAEMFQTKHCVIDSISINYSPENNLSFFNDGANSPAFVSLSISLREIEMFTGEDFGREGRNVEAADLVNFENSVANNANNVEAYLPNEEPEQTE